jgi:hypothetical protein
MSQIGAFDKEAETASMMMDIDAVAVGVGGMSGHGGLRPRLS